MDAALPAKVKRQIAALKPQMYVVDARAVADSVGLGKRINMVMQTVFFALSGVVPISKVSITCWYQLLALTVAVMEERQLQTCKFWVVYLAIAHTYLLCLQAIPMLKESIVKAYGKKGEKVVAQNHAAVDGSVSSIIKIDVPKEWADATDGTRLGMSHTPAAQKAAQQGPAHFLEEVVKPILAMEGDRLPVRCWSGI